MNQTSTLAARLAACCTGVVYDLLRVHGLGAPTLAASMRPQSTGQLPVFIA